MNIIASRNQNTSARRAHLDMVRNLLRVNILYVKVVNRALQANSVPNFKKILEVLGGVHDTAKS